MDKDPSGQPEEELAQEQESVALQGTVGVPLLIGKEEIDAIAEGFALGRHGKPYTEDELEALVFWASDAVFRYKMFRALVDGVVTIDITENHELFFDVVREGEQPSEEATEDANAG